MPVHIGSNPTEEVIDLDEILGRDSADEEWDLRCGEQHDLALLSTKQLMYSLKAHVRQTKKLSGEWVAMKIEAANAKKQLDDERKGFEEVKSKLMADLAEANKTAESAQIREEMRAQSLLPPAPLPLKATVLFHDCIGRHYKIPFEKCNRWREMRALICHSFAHHDALAGPVYSGEYDLTGPDDECIMKDYWDAAIEPGMTVKMLMWPLSIRKDRGNSDSDSDTEVCDEDVDVGDCRPVSPAYEVVEVADLPEIPEISPAEEPDAFEVVLRSECPLEDADAAQARGSGER